MNPVHFAFLLTTIAGLSTGVGSLIAYWIKKPKVSYLAFSLGLSGGVMVYVSLMELLPEAMESTGELKGFLVFLLGIFVIAVIDQLVPEFENPHHYSDEEYIDKTLKSHQKEEKPGKNTSKLSKSKVERSDKQNGVENINSKELFKTGAITALALAIHNFPEGLATFSVALGDPTLAVAVTFAIAIHNIPEGISVSIPIFYATQNEKKAFWMSFFSGVAEPLGATVGYFLLREYLNKEVIGALLAFVSGIMIYISFDEILPTAHRYETGHLVILGVIIGITVMGFSLIIL